ncbi:CCHC-type domain-containing protein [Trichonephila clavipes]|uniref:CCHC-type domain-containing protein n=1 Tax=Trichonephila clavipes TaxID=2585209 RepID=A0A8X6R7W3_TRICX|nr:CCHC-type domain-containing protein [Trichonephila clavipes]
MEFKANIERLVGATNWSKWKRQIELFLRHHDVHDVECGDRKFSSLPTEASAETIAAHEKVQKAFIKGNSLTQLILVGNRGDNNTELTAICNRKKIFKKPERKSYVRHKPGHFSKDCWKKESKLKVEGDAFVCTVKGVPESEVWIADRSTSAHMTKHKNYFVDLTQFISPKPVYVGNRDEIMAYGHGTVNIEIRIISKWKKHHLTEVWYVPDISRNLFSIG